MVLWYIGICVLLIVQYDKSKVCVWDTRLRKGFSVSVATCLVDWMHVAMIIVSLCI